MGTVPIPKSATKSRILENIDIFDFKLTVEETAIMDSFHTGVRIFKQPDDLTKYKYWPFSIEY